MNSNVKLEITSEFSPAAGWTTRHDGDRLETVELLQDDRVRRIQEDVHEIGRQQRDREQQDLAGRDPHRRRPEPGDHPAPAEDLPQDHHVERDPERPGGDVADGQEADTAAADDQQENDGQAQSRARGRTCGRRSTAGWRTPT